MTNKEFPYSEDILQWIWKNLFFDGKNLVSEEGLSIQILEQGTLNTSNGPDFKNARVIIDGVMWLGSIELHLKSSVWKLHKHHTDDAYNQVILHVVVEENPKHVIKEDGSSPPTLNLLPYLSKDLSGFIKNLDFTSKLPCSSSVSFISEEAFAKQIDKAHTEYLEKKANDFLRFYNPELIPSEAWKNALILSLFDGYGITHNRESMLEVGKWFIHQNESNAEKLTQFALEFAGFGNLDSSLNWNLKGVFPANHPKKRLVEVIKLALLIREVSFDFFIENEPLVIWSFLIDRVGLKSSQKPKILYGIVLLPALHVLGSLFKINELTSKVNKQWGSLQLPIPKSVLSSFTSIREISSSIYSKKLGSVHQIRSYCEPRRCHECIVLKKVISS